jgi:hypothetical protein
MFLKQQNKTKSAFEIFIFVFIIILFLKLNERTLLKIISELKELHVIQK